MVQFILDANSPEAQSGFGSIPGGTYTAQITNSYDKTSKDGSKRWMEYEITIIEGEYRGRKLWERFHIYDPSKPGGISWAKQKNGEICRACKVANMKDSADLHNIPMTITVREYEDEQYGMRNEITSYSQIASLSQNTNAPQNESAPW